MKKLTIVLWIFTALFVVIGIWVSKEAISSKYWQQTTAKIINSRVSSRISTSSTRSFIRIWTYYVTANYRYKFNGKEYTGSRYTIGTGDTISGPYNEKSEAREWLKNSEYKINNQINIYVDPNNPSKSVISNKLHWSAFGPFVMAFLFMILALIIKIIHHYTPNSRKQ